MAGSALQQNEQATIATRRNVFSNENIQAVTQPKSTRKLHLQKVEKQRLENQAQAKERVGQLSHLLGAAVQMQKEDMEQRKAKEERKEREEKRRRFDSVDSAENDSIVQLVKPWSRLIKSPILRMEVITEITPILLTAAQKQQAMD